LFGHAARLECRTHSPLTPSHCMPLRTAPHRTACSDRTPHVGPLPPGRRTPAPVPAYRAPAPQCPCPGPCTVLRPVPLPQCPQDAAVPQDAGNPAPLRPGRRTPGNAGIRAPRTPHGLPAPHLCFGDHKVPICRIFPARGPAQDADSRSQSIKLLDLWGGRTSTFEGSPGGRASAM
jgi:hypothetical protein